MLAAPSVVVAVPITEAPSFASAIAIALPSPRVAPVTSASCAESGPVVVISSSTRSERSERFFDARAIVQRKGRNVLIDATGEPRQHLARTALDDVRDTARRERLDRFTPPHRIGRLARERASMRRSQRG